MPWKGGCGYSTRVGAHPSAQFATSEGQLTTHTNLGPAVVVTGVDRKVLIGTLLSADPTSLAVAWVNRAGRGDRFQGYASETWLGRNQGQGQNRFWTRPTLIPATRRETPATVRGPQ